ncbi:MAG: hypothetical protein AMDU5_GPLC00004G0289 [Thermoplasmatales archaeon Gpl]|jgi:1-aminocyclopropane-1-carboxylate deaminase/D-cysteine desulfhydrase-like pyridoxal-dependent ACC family enzyme|nr:MAG: hypothetical protein AMDU5_GPLC00004G0289 [Thermoplasmatales archaeon Gpl]
MITTTTFHVDSDNIEFVIELSKKRELSKILNFLLREYAKDKGYANSTNKIRDLEYLLDKKSKQYDALKNERNIDPLYVQK